MADVLLQVQDLSKRFRSNYSDLWAVRDVSFDLLPGQRLVITGPSGCGKTTLLNLIGLIMEASSGDVRYQEASLFEMRDHAQARMRNELFILTQVTAIAFLVVILLIFYAIMRIVANHAHKMRRDYAIHMMYGATRFEVHLHSMLLHAVFIMLPALAAIREYRVRSFFESSHLITGVLVIAGLLTLGLSYYNSRIIVREAMTTITSGTDVIR